MFVDYAGPPLFITDRYTSVRTAVRVFVAAMGCSHAIYAHATPGERTMDWLDGHVQGLAYFGGVPDKIVPDNAKGVVAKTCRYEPVLNASYTDFARHYDCAVVPTRVRRPQDKAKVENAVQILERALFPELMAATFFDIESLNVALREGIDRVNAKPFQKRDGSRYSRLAEERAALKPLPATPYEFAQWKRAKVQLARVRSASSGTPCGSGPAKLFRSISTLEKPLIFASARTPLKCFCAVVESPAT